MNEKCDDCGAHEYPLMVCSFARDGSPAEELKGERLADWLGDEAKSFFAAGGTAEIWWNGDSMIGASEGEPCSTLRSLRDGILRIACRRAWN